MYPVADLIILQNYKSRKVTVAWQEPASRKPDQRSFFDRLMGEE